MLNIVQVESETQQITTVVLNLDNGSENHRRHTQFMQRLTALIDDFQVMVDLAYYPPYHSIG